MSKLNSITTYDTMSESVQGSAKKASLLQEVSIEIVSSHTKKHIMTIKCQRFDVERTLKQFGANDEEIKKIKLMLNSKYGSIV